MTPTFETPRLLLYPVGLVDADQIQQIFPQWEVVRYLSNRVPWPYPSNAAHKFLSEIALPAVERGDSWNWTLRLKQEPAWIVGCIELRKTENKNRGFWLDPKWHQRGLMTEACETVTDFWFDVLKFPVLRVPKAIANAASRRISEKQGMRVIRTEDRDYVSGRLPSEVWEITAHEWRARKSGSQR
jgi:[ribosomal protein S5]-alanine N-acetyltransferase